MEKNARKEGKEEKCKAQRTNTRRKGKRKRRIKEVRERLYTEKWKQKNKEKCVCVIECDQMQQSLFIPTRVGRLRKNEKKERTINVFGHRCV